MNKAAIFYFSSLKKLWIMFHLISSFLFQSHCTVHVFCCLMFNSNLHHCFSKHELYVKSELANNNMKKKNCAELRITQHSSSFCRSQI